MTVHQDRVRVGNGAEKTNNSPRHSTWFYDATDADGGGFTLTALGFSGHGSNLLCLMFLLQALALSTSGKPSRTSNSPLYSKRPPILAGRRVIRHPPGDYPGPEQPHGEAQANSVKPISVTRRPSPHLPAMQSQPQGIMASLTGLVSGGLA